MSALHLVGLNKVIPKKIVEVRKKKILVVSEIAEKSENYKMEERALYHKDALQSIVI